MMDLMTWDDAEYKLKFVLDNPNIQLPRTVRVIQGYMIDEDDAIASGQVLTMHGKKKTDQLIGHDINGKELAIPLSCTYKVKLISTHNQRQFKCINEICYSEDPPKFVKIKNEHALASGNILEKDSLLEIKHVLSDNGSIIALNCLIFRDGVEEQVVTLPIDFQSSFTECLPPDVYIKEYLLNDLYNEYGAPFSFQFLNVNNNECSYGPDLGVINIEKKLSQTMVMATSIIENVKHALTFSAEIPITIQIATKEKEVNSRNDTIDLKKFDYLPANNPYTNGILQDQIYDELLTPSIGRRTGRLSYREGSQTSKHSSRSRSFTNPDSMERPSLRRNKSSVKSKLSFIKKSVTKLTSSIKHNQHNDKESKIDFLSTQKFSTNRDCAASIGGCSIDVTSNGSASIYSESFKNLMDCMDAFSIDHQPTEPARHSRQLSKGSSDSGISSVRLRRRSRSRTRSRLTLETPSSNMSDSTFENMSEWSLPRDSKESPIMKKKLNTTKKESNNYLWSTEIKSKDVDVDTGEKDNNKIEYTKQNIDQSDSLANFSPFTVKQRQSREEIKSLNEAAVGALLDRLQLSEFKDIFQQNQINGKLLLELEIYDFVNDIKLSLFQARKIMKYINGWRPESHTNQPTPSSRRNSSNPRDWSVNDVLFHMTTINLTEFGHFCSKNQVNGDLLLDILDNETLKSIKNKHNVRMTSLEAKKLLNFVVKGWRPDNSPKKSLVY